MIVRSNPDSTAADKRREYLQGQIEFDPQIKTKIGQFQRKYFNKSMTQIELFDKIREFTGAVASDINDEFFMAVKVKNYDKWKKAVSVFYRNYDFDIDKYLK